MLFNNNIYSLKKKKKLTKTIGHVIKADSMKLTAFFFKIQKLTFADTKITAIIRKVTAYSAIFPFFRSTQITVDAISLSNLCLFVNCL